MTAFTMIPARGRTRRHELSALARPSAVAVALGGALFTAGAAATDCDRNGVDDATEVAAGAPDCNGNLLPDPCDLAPGAAFGGARLFVIGSAGSSDLDTIDHDGDGDLDLLVAESTADHVSVLLGDGARGFDSGYPLPMGSQPRSVEVVDVDGDGRRDIVVGLRSDMRILRARAGGGFDGGPLPGSPTDIVDLQSGDLDGDGDVDFLVQSRGFLEGRLRELWLNDGAGGLSFHSRLDEPPYFRRVEIAGDIDRDGTTDLVALGSAALGSAAVVILWNRGDATFESTSVEGVSGFARTSSSDLDGDGDLEIAVSMDAPGIAILWNDGQRRLRRADVSLGGGRGMTSLAAADLDVDGRIDLAGLSGDVIVLRNLGQESFELGTVGSVISGVLSNLKAHDLDGDGRTDLIFSGQANPTFGHSWAFSGVLWNDQGGFAQIDHISLGRFPVGVSMGDLDDDGDLDLATANRASRNVSVLLNQGRAVDFSRTSYAVHGNPASIVQGDLDGDGDEDLAVPNEDRDTVTILWNSGRGAFTSRLDIAVGSKPSDLEAADLEGDGDIDLVTVSQESLDAAVLLAGGGGTFAAPVSSPVGAEAVAVSAADLDADGTVDLAVLDASTPAIHILVRNEAATFRVASSWPVEGLENAYNLADALLAKDMDGDGAWDLVTGTWELISVLWNGGTGTFEDRLLLASRGGNAPGLEAGDVDGDGFLDLAAALQTNVAGFVVLRGAGSRRFSLPEALGSSEITSSSAIGDLDGDGRQDLALAQSIPRDGVAVLLSTESPARAVDLDGNGWPDACDDIVFLRGDTNGDRVVDLTDMVSILLYLFASGVVPTCADRADVDDGGRLNITDAIFGLSYLFLGGPEPPLPGADMEGYDRTPTDPFPCGDAVECELPSSSTLPGVTLDVSGNPCVFTLAEARAGIAFRYKLSVQRGLAEVTIPNYPGTTCHDPGEHGLSSLEVIAGGDQSYCVCDKGLCPWTDLRTSLEAGTYETVLPWTGKNWTGPSDFFNPMGPPFPPGKYTFRVLIRGSYRDDDGVEVGFEVRGGSSFELVP